MAGWSMLDDRLVIDSAKTPQKLKAEGFLVDLEPFAEESGVEVEVGSDNSVIQGVSDKVRCFFVRFLRLFLKEICTHYSFRPIPPVLGNGKPVDLYKLFVIVKDKGGYDAVSKRGLWDLVGRESGFGLTIGSLVKLLYSKYLHTLEIWLKKVSKNKVSDSGLVDDRVTFDKRLMELHAEIPGLLSDFTDEVVGNEMREHFDFKRELDNEVGEKLCDGAKKVQIGEHIDLDMPECGMHEHSLDHSCKNDDAVETLEELGGGMISMKGVVNVSNVGILGDNNDGNVLILNPSSVNKESFGRKRKRESLWEMLTWVTGIARNPCDPVIGSITEKSKWKSHSNEEIWKQVLLFREAVFLKRNVDSSGEHVNWQSQKMHPCLYDDHLGASYNLRERLKGDRRLILGLSTSGVQVPSDYLSRTQGDLERTSSSHEDCADELLFDSFTAYSGLNKCSTMHVRLGSAYQAEVPEWTGMTSESDVKWLGTQIWPSETVNWKLLIERDPIGKGRQDSCGCPVPDSVDCVRFHIAEKRTKIKLELGVAFYQWSLDRVGEEVRHLWTEEEEKKFKAVVRSNLSSLEKYFWDHIFRSFPKKTREDLVSYYFNVYLLQRRGYQNRHTPNDIDSDDDESGCGPLRNVFGHQAQQSSILSPKKPQTKCR